MIDNLLSLVKGQVGDQLASKFSLPAGKSEQCIEEGTKSVVESVKGELNAGNLGSIQGLLGGGGIDSIMQTGMGEGMVNNVVSSLTSKVGLSPDMAKNVSGYIVPVIVQKIGGLVSGGDGKPNISSIMGMLGGGDSSSIKNVAEGLLGDTGKSILGKFF